jgi:hypothetical protein
MDESMLRYVGDFKRLDFHNIKTIKFFNADNFDEFQVAPSTVHHRLIMNAVAKHQTPHSKLGWSGNEKKQNVFELKKLSFVAGNTFHDDDEEGEQQQFVYGRFNFGKLRLLYIFFFWLVMFCFGFFLEKKCRSLMLKENKASVFHPPPLFLLKKDTSKNACLHLCMFPVLKYFAITLPYYLCNIIHILLLIATNI